MVYCLLFMIQTTLGVDCYVPGSDVLKYEIVSDNNVDIVDVDNNFLKKALHSSFDHYFYPLLPGATKIWENESGDDGGNLRTVYFRQEFNIIGVPIFGHLTTGCDYSITTLINGVDINCGAGNPYVLVSCDVLRFLKPHYNVIRFGCWSDGGGAYFSFKLSIESRV